MVPKKSKFHLFAFQRIILRGCARSNQSFVTASRGTSKSFLADSDRYIHCMTIPRHNVTITAGTNKQAAEIAKQKIIDDLWVKFPLMGNEMQKSRVMGKLNEAYKAGNDYVQFNFKNGSRLDLGNVRGLRKESIIFEEIIEQDATKVNEVYIPMLNRPRATSYGVINPYEPQSQQIYITTAGYQQTFSHDKLLETICLCVLHPEQYFVFCSTYKIPLKLGLTSAVQIQQILNSPSFSKASFDREYMSRWSNSPVGAAFNPNNIVGTRQVKRVELKAGQSQTDFYIMSADMAKDGSAETIVEIYRVTPKDTCFHYKCVNLFPIHSTNYEVVANELKRAIRDFHIVLFIYDANGIGASLRDWINKETIDERTGEKLPGYGIINPPESAQKDVIRYTTAQTICYELKTGGRTGSDIHKFYLGRMSNGSITYPIPLSKAVDLLQDNPTFVKMSAAKKEKMLSIYKNMDVMELELKNLDISDKSDNVNSMINIVRRDSKIQKDYFSAAEYAI